MCLISSFFLPSACASVGDRLRIANLIKISRDVSVTETGLWSSNADECTFCTVQFTFPM